MASQARVNFKLTFNGEIHRFRSNLRGESLFKALSSKVAAVASDYAYELFWNDGESDNVLASATDLATAIDFATVTRANPSDAPCVQLIAIETKPDCGELIEVVTNNKEDGSAAVASADASVPPPNLLPRIKEHFARLLDSALVFPWSTELRRAIVPLRCPRTGLLQKPSDVCVAEIALELLRMEKRVPGELAEMMRQLNGQDFRDILQDEDWLMEVAQVQARAKGMLLDSNVLRSAVTDVRMAVMMAVDLPSLHYLEEYQCAGGYDTHENEEEEKQEEIADDWIGRSAEAIRKRAEVFDHAACANRVYPSPEEFLRKAAERDSAAEATNSIVKQAPMDRVDRLRKHLDHLPSSIPNILQSTIAYEICERASTLEYVDWYYHRYEDKDREVSAQTEIDAILRRTTENVPEDLEHELKSMNPQSLAKVVLMDWMDRLAEEREAVRSLQMKTEQVQQPTRCPPSALYGLMKVAAAAEVYPEELKRAVEMVIEKQKEEDRKDDETYKKKLNPEQLQQRNQSGIHIGIEYALAEYMPSNKVRAFLICMVPSPQPPSAPIYRDPAQHIKTLSELVKSLDMETEMQVFMKNPWKLHTEIARMLGFYAQTASANRVERLKEMDPLKLSRMMLDFWMISEGRAIFAKRKAEKDQERGEDGEVTGEDEDQNKPPTKMSSVTLAALIITDVLCPNKWQQLDKWVEYHKIRKSLEQPHSDAELSDMPAWIVQQAAAMLQQGMARLAPELQQQQPSIHCQPPAQPNGLMHALSIAMQSFPKLASLQ